MWTAGAILQSTLALLVMPTLGWRWLLGLSSAPLFAFILTFKALPESPRFYVSRGYTADAMKVLKKMAKENGKLLPDGVLIASSVKGQHKATQWRDLFLPEYLRITIMAAVMSVSGNTAYYGTSILTTSLFEHDDGCHGSSNGVAKGANNCEAFCETLSEGDYVDFMITSLSELPGIFLSMFLMSQFGRKTVQTGLYFAFTVVTLLCNICAPRMALVALLFVARALGNGVAQGNYLYSAELFPTSIRAKGLGWCSGVSRVGITAAPFIAQVLIQVSAYVSISVFAFLGMLGGVAAMLIPVETATRK
ncbi:hypothetical protein Btru_004532 [Bulinus truncatus]|nr:hypothetical protein Btru_004532 [Bulinus truncatus]